MLIVLEAERYALGVTMGGVMIIAWGYILCRDNLACYHQIRRGLLAKRTLPIAKQTMELLSRLFTDSGVKPRRSGRGYRPRKPGADFI